MHKRDAPLRQPIEQRGFTDIGPAQDDNDGLHEGTPVSLRP
jgi:hypothetical protein